MVLQLEVLAELPTNVSVPTPDLARLTFATPQKHDSRSSLKGAHSEAVRGFAPKGMHDPRRAASILMQACHPAAVTIHPTAGPSR